MQVDIAVGIHLHAVVEEEVEAPVRMAKKLQKGLSGFAGAERAVVQHRVPKLLRPRIDEHLTGDLQIGCMYQPRQHHGGHGDRGRRPGGAQFAILQFARQDNRLQLGRGAGTFGHSSAASFSSSFMRAAPPTLST